MSSFVAVALNRPFKEPFHYSVPVELQSFAAVGCRVKVPLGRQKTVGMIVEVLKESSVSGMKSIDDVIDHEPIIQPELLQLAQWMNRYYFVSLGEILFAMFPPELKEPKSYYEQDSLTLHLDEAQLLQWQEEHKRKKNMQKLLSALHQNSGMSIMDLKKRCDFSGFTATLKGLMQDGVVGIADVEQQSHPSKVTLNDEQDKAARRIVEVADRREFHTFLLHGVTGSGKTEVYMHAAMHVLERGQGALVMVPEIALTPQLYARFEERFPGSVAILHSQLTATERQRIWWKIKKGEMRVVVGSRSVVFAPIQNLGLIVVDEEHESSYKQEETPRYNGRDVAVMRAKQLGIPVVLGSATPSFETFYNMKNKKYELLEMTKRAGAGSLPQTYLVDMRFDARKNFLFSRLLFEKVLERLKNKEQIILFLNRRGTAPAMLCEACGETTMCPRCDVSLTYHARKKILCCHYCDWNEPALTNCKSCKSPLKPMGVGTQRLEEEVKTLFRDVRVGRLDTDVAAKRGAVQQVLADFDAHKIDILVGTQMIAKGLDVHNVTLIGVMYADSGLFMPDFRASEKTFQLVHQVAGRAGRGDKKGEVVIQTYNADNRTLQCALKGDYHAFYEQEIADRRDMRYAPVCRLAEVLFRGPRADHVQAAARKFAQLLRGHAKDDKTLQILGPAPMPIAKLNHQFRWHLLIKSSQLPVLQEFLQHTLHDMGVQRGVKVMVNIDPISMI